MAKIAVRPYYCPVCGNDELHSTNHTGEIYCHCKQCGNTPLYCRDAEPHTGPTKQAVIRFYRIVTDTPEGKEQYKTLRDMVTACGFKMFNVLGEHRSVAAMSQHDGETITLYYPEQFTGQYVSNIGRVHDWFEAVYPNRHVKHGYYLEF